MVQDLVDAGHDRHVQAHAADPLVDAPGGEDALGHLRAGGQLGERLAAGDRLAEPAVPAVPAVSDCSFPQFAAFVQSAVAGVQKRAK